MTSTTYAAWSTIAPITIANAPGVADYPVRVNLTYAAEMGADFADIRFVDSSDTALSYWIESFTASTSAVIWIKVASGTTAISLVYGNAAATSESNGSAVFDFFDDFSGSAVDTSKWTVTQGSGTITVSGGLLRMTTTTNVETNIVAKSSFGENTRAVARYKVDHVDDGYIYEEFGVIRADGQRLCRIIASHDTGGRQRFFNWNGASNLAAITGGLSEGIFFRAQLARAGATGAVWTIDARAPQTHAANYPNGENMAPHFRVYGNPAGITVDYVFVGKWQSAEPVCTVGTAESNSVSLVPKTFRVLYDVLPPVGKTARGVYDIYDPVGKTFRALHDVSCSPFGRQLRGVYDVLLFVPKRLGARYDIEVTLRLGALYDILAPAGRSLKGVYDIGVPSRFRCVYDVAWALQLRLPYDIRTDRRVRGVYSATSEKTLRGCYSVLEPAGLRARFVVQILNKSFLTVVSDHRLTVKLDQLPYYKCTFRNPPPIYRDTYIKEGNEIRVLYNDVVLFSGTITSTEKIAGSQNIAVEAWGSEKDLEALKVQSKSQFVTTPANEIAEALLPDAWEGEIDVMPAISYTTEYGDILTHVANLAAIAGRDWSARQTVATVTVDDIVEGAESVQVVVSGDALTDDAIDRYAFVLTGPDVYKGAQVFDATENTLTFAGDPFPRLRIGDRISVYLKHRLDLTERPSSGTAKFKALLNRGIKKVSRTLDLERVYSVIVVPGASSMAANQSSVFPVVTIPSHWAETTVTESMLADQGADICLSSTATSVILSDAADYPASGVVGIEAEQIRYTGKTGNTLTGCTRGVNGTAAAAHNIFAPVLLVSEYPMRNTGFLAASGSVWMGMEKVSYTAKREGSILGLTRGVGTRAYPHGSGTVVRNAAYTVAAPEAGSPYALYGERALNVPAVGAVDQHTLDVVAQTYARFSTSLTEWGEGTLARPSLPNGMRVGDWFTLGEYIDGVLTDTDYRVVGVELDGKTCKMFFGETEEFILDRLRGIDKAMDMAGIKDDKPGIGTVVGISCNREVVKVQMGDGSYTYSRLK